MKTLAYFARQLGKPTGWIGKWVLAPLWNHRNRALNDLTLAELELTPADRLLDIGFGGGYLMAMAHTTAHPALVAGLDISPAMVQNAQKRWRAEIAAGRVVVQLGSAEALPFPDAHFTKICSVNSIFYWSDPQQGLREIYRALQPAGRAVLTFTRPESIRRKWFAPYAVKSLQPQAVHDLLADAGFQHIQIVSAEDQHRQFVCLIAVK